MAANGYALDVRHAFSTGPSSPTTQLLRKSLLLKLPTITSIGLNKAPSLPDGITSARLGLIYCESTYGAIGSLTRPAAKSSQSTKLPEV